MAVKMMRDVRTNNIPTIIVLKYHVRYLKSCHTCAMPARKKSTQARTARAKEGV